MKSIITSILLLAAVTGFGQSAKKDMAILYTGTPESKFADAQINITYTGKTDKLLEAIAAAHGTKFELLKEGEGVTEYRAVQITKPVWVYGNYNVHVQVKAGEKGTSQIAIWHTYYNKTQNITGSTLAKLEADVLEFYQEAVKIALGKK